MRHPKFLIDAGYEFQQTRKNGRLYQKLFDFRAGQETPFGFMGITDILSVEILKTLYGRFVKYYVRMVNLNGGAVCSPMMDEVTLEKKILDFEEKIVKIATPRK
jgi:hypothetical protein